MTEHDNHSSGSPVLVASQPPVISDYVSVILRAIERTQHDPVQLRALVYDLARINLRRQLIVNYRQVGSDGLRQHLLALETAIKQVDVIAERDAEFLRDEPRLPMIERPNDSFHHSDSRIITTRKIDINVEGDAPPLVVRQVPNDVIEVAEPITYFGARSNSKGRWVLPAITVSAICASLAAFAIAFVAYNFGNHVTNLRDVVHPGAESSSLPTSQPMLRSTSAAISEELPTDRAVSPALQLPKAYGIFALSEGKLYELSALPIRVPDSRVAISAIFTSPGRVTVPNGKISFIIFRRDLLSAAPDQVFVRVIARVVHEMRFTGSGHPIKIKLGDQWAVRSKAYEFRVAPLDQHPEMMSLHSQTDQSLPPGRYALVLKGQGYDFTVDGQPSDASHCLEKTAIPEIIYSECRNAFIAE